eukprot:scaffold235183_cov30-Tisochrysis_lutea.AAC.2
MSNEGGWAASAQGKTAASFGEGGPPCSGGSPATSGWGQDGQLSPPPAISCPAISPTLMESRRPLSGFRCSLSSLAGELALGPKLATSSSPRKLALRLKCARSSAPRLLARRLRQPKSSAPRPLACRLSCGTRSASSAVSLSRWLRWARRSAPLALPRRLRLAILFLFSCITALLSMAVAV